MVVSEPEYVEIYRVGSLDAEMVRSVLEGNEIECMLTGSGMGGAYPMNVGTLGSAGVLVRTEDVQRARELIEQVVRGDFALEDDELPEGSEEPE